jgi:predicted nucleotidyltransferase
MSIDRSAIGGLSVHAVVAIRHVLTMHSPIDRAILFGSRAKGNYKNGSDIDLAVFGNVDDSELGAIAGELDDLLLPWEIDLVQFDRITNQDLREHISRVGQVFYSKLEMAA